MTFDYNPNTIWISHSALQDFEKCPRLYYLRSIYRDKKFGNNFRIQMANPYLSLGEIVHDAIDNYTNRYELGSRNKDKMMYELSRGWMLKKGKIGGFKSESHEKEFKDRSISMVERFLANKDFAEAKSLSSPNFPKIKLFPDKDLVLVGNFDWIAPFDDGLHIVDFKTGQHEEDEGSLQLPIYSILANENLDKPVRKTSYWYLDKDDEPKEVDMKDLDKSLDIIKEKSLALEKARKENNFSDHKSENCFFCKEYETVLASKAEHVGTDHKRKREIFFIL
ncbi:PD-(D/E)XK nuclease family protein [Patescibacteria group bacterium]|nr:PD-(D/E)XK nuclease family protein [Patescibacteria group bacterium]